MYLNKLFQPRLLVLLSGIVCLWASSNINWGGNRFQGIIKSDGKGYYAYLPAIFIYKDLSFSWVDEVELGKYYNKNYFFDYRQIHHGDTVNKYYAGTAIAMLPFFGIGSLHTWLIGEAVDGYSKYHQIWIQIGAIIWSMLALLLINRLLKGFGFAPNIRSWTLIFILFGTNWFYYLISEPAMSHHYSLALICAFLLLARKIIQQGITPLRSLILGIVLGWIFITRPANIIVFPSILIFFTHLSQVGVWLRAQRTKLLGLGAFTLLGSLIGVLPQVLIYLKQTGSLWIYSYGNEVFDFTNPHIWEMMFSYRKGFFVYTPIALLSFWGLYAQWKAAKWPVVVFLIWFGILVFVLSSWWNWYYGGSFSQRVFIEFYALFAWMLAWSLKGFEQGLKRNLWIGLLFLLLMFNQFQIYQYRYGLIHWSEMSKERYWDVFLKL